MKNQNSLPSAHRCQFGFKWLLVATVIVAAYFGGRASRETEIRELNLSLKDLSNQNDRLKAFVGMDRSVEIPQFRDMIEQARKLNEHVSTKP